MNRLIASAPRLSQQAIRQIAVRQLASSTAEQENVVDIAKLKECQKRFQVANDIPIYLKGGLIDRILFGATVVMCIYGLGYSAKVIYTLSVPPSNS